MGIALTYDRTVANCLINHPELMSFVFKKYPLQEFNIYTWKKLSITHSLTKHFYFDLINNPAKKQNRIIILSVNKWVYQESAFEITAFSGLQVQLIWMHFLTLHMVTSMVL